MRILKNNPKHIKKHKKSSYIIFISLIFSIFMNTINLTQLNLNSTDNSNIVPNIIEENKENDVSNLLKTSGTFSWWNASYRYRLEVVFEEPGYSNRTNEPVDVYLTFDNGKCHKNTVRVVENNIYEISYQIWNETMWDSTYIKSATLTFLATVLKDENASYLVYYSDQDNNGAILNPNQKYIDNSGFSSNLQGTQLNITTTEFSLNLEDGKGVYEFSKAGTNFHKENSLSPWIKNGNLDYHIYYPDPVEGGAITSWLVLGSFTYFNPDWNNVITASKYHFDVTKQYIAGDHATGGDAVGFLDESKDWRFKEFKGQYTYTTNNGFMDLNAYFQSIGEANEYRCGYASAYIMSPVTLNNAYLKVGSDDGIRIWRDGVKIHDNHVLRGPQPDREAIGPMTFEAGRWYYFIVLVEENTGNWGFNFRFSNNSNLYGSSPQNDPNGITNLKIAMRPPLPTITSISEVQKGPIFSQYDLTWEDSVDMKTLDRITIYNNYTLWKTERTLWWADDQVNSSFSVLNTLYDISSGSFNNILADNQINSLSDITSVENYTVVYDTGSPYTALGIFMTNKQPGNAFMNLNKLLGDIHGNATEVNFRPGTETDLINNGPHTWPGDQDYNVEIIYWELLDENFGTDANKAVLKSNDTSYPLKNPLTNIKNQEESSFFDLTIITKDRDGFTVEDVKVYLYNSTGFVDNQSTNSEGSTTFIRLPKENYTLNFTFSKPGFSEFFVKTNINVTLNESKNIIVDDLSLTSLDIELIREASTDKIAGAEVQFWFINSSGVIEYQIGNEISDSNGKVLFVWKNISQTEGNISVSVNLLGAPRLLNLTSNYLNYTFENRINTTIRVQINQYETGLNRISPIGTTINDKFKGESIYLEYWYYYNQSGTTYNITGASVRYSIKNTITQEVKGTGLFDPDVYPIGFYNLTIDTDNPILNLKAGGITYLIEITAQKAGYTIKTDAISLTLKEILTNLTATTESLNINIPWYSNFTARVYYNDTINGFGLNGSTVTYSVPGKISGSFKEETTAGWYNLTLNSSVFIQKGDYIMSIRAFKQNYIFQEIFINITITQIATNLYANVSRIDKIWNKNFSIAVTFNDTDNNKLLNGATVTYRALGTVKEISGSLVGLGNGNYTFTINTTIFEDVGSYILEIKAEKLNYEIKTINLPLVSLHVPKIRNNTFSIINSIDVSVGTIRLYSFNYTFEETNLGIEDATAHYQWQKVGGSFNPGDLYNTTTEGEYVLDFDTGHRELGTYNIIITIEKKNHETRSATLIINIIRREIQPTLSSNFAGGQINVVKGKTISISVTLLDPTPDLNQNDPLLNATVVLVIEGSNYELEEISPGVYEYLFSTQEYFTLFSPLTLTGKITISATNYTSTEIQITIVIGMDEIFEGIPTFYFFLIVIALGAILGSLIGSRVIRQARIPAFVKKVRSMKNAIKGKKSISESILYPPKEDFIIQMFGDRWEKLGLSLEDILGLEGKKGKKGTITEIKKELKGGKD